MKRFITNLKFPLLTNGRANFIGCNPQESRGTSSCHEVYRSEFLNGMKMTCLKSSGAALCAFTIMFQAGSRYECGDLLGSSHYMRMASVNTGCVSSKFMRSRYLQQRGAYITTSADRQTISYSMRCTVNCFEDIMFHILDAGPLNKLLDHEMDDLHEMVRLDLNRRDPQRHCFDLIQRASFSGSLANSIYCPRHRMGRVTGETLRMFRDNFFNTAGCCVATYGIDFEDALRVVAQVDCEQETKGRVSKSEPWTYKSGEERYDIAGDGYIYVALAVPGVPMTNFDCALQHAIIAAAIGAGTVLKGTHLADFVSAEPLECLIPGAYETEFRAFNISYLDAGLFGLMIRTKKNRAEEAVVKASKLMGCIHDLTVCQINVGKQRLKVGCLINDAKVSRLLEGVALQSMAGVGQLWENTEQLCSIIDGVPAETIWGTAETLSRKRNVMSMAIVGDGQCVPHLTDII